MTLPSHNRRSKAINVAALAMHTDAAKYPTNKCPTCLRWWLLRVRAVHPGRDHGKEPRMFTERFTKFAVAALAAGAIGLGGFAAAGTASAAVFPSGPSHQASDHR
jgi:hypothetical protein